jgi:hypothetical protein
MAALPPAYRRRADAGFSFFNIDCFFIKPKIRGAAQSLCFRP